MQHPTPSRRFLPVPSGVSSAAKFPPKTPGPFRHASQEVQIAGLSSTRQFLKTPHCNTLTEATRAGLADEIDTDRDADLSSSPPLPPRPRFSSSVLSGKDVIDDGYDDDDDDATDLPRVRVDQFQRKYGNEEDEDPADLLGLETSRDIKPPSGTGADPIHDPSEDSDLVTPLPRKRRRRRRSSENENERDVDLISSSSSVDTVITGCYEHEDETNVRLDTNPTATDPIEKQCADDDDDDNTSSPTRPKPSTTNSRFKAPTPAIFPTSSSVFRPSFRPQPPDTTPATASNATVPSALLPPAFSPSRRRGKKDYVPGGFADTARGWVLGLAAEETRRRAGGVPSHVTEIPVAEVRHDDGEKRCVLMTSEVGRRWILVGEGGTGYSSSSVGDDKMEVKVGSLIGVRGAGMTWELDIGDGEFLERGGEEAGSGAESQEHWRVGVLWDVVG